MCIEAARDALEVLGPAHSEKSYEVSARVSARFLCAPDLARAPAQEVICNKLYDARVPDCARRARAGLSMCRPRRRSSATSCTTHACQTAHVPPVQEVICNKLHDARVPD